MPTLSLCNSGLIGYRSGVERRLSHLRLNRGENAVGAPLLRQNFCRVDEENVAVGFQFDTCFICQRRRLSISENGVGEVVFIEIDSTR